MKLKQFLMMLFCLLFAGSICAQSSDVNGILYVKKGSSGNGSSWANALGEVADALKFAKDQEKAGNQAVKEIWVAAGTYKPMYSPIDGDNLKADPSDLRNRAFLLVKDVKLYGGFAGTETNLSERNWNTNKTILSGDLNGDDGANFANNSENAYHVVISAGDVGIASLDGFTITGGYSNGNGRVIVNGIRFIIQAVGAGMYNYQSSPALTNVIISKNKSESNAGGMFNWYSSPVLTNVTILGNTGATAGGMHNAGSSPILTNVTILGNTASRYGGGMFNDHSSPILTNVTISANRADNGGGMYNTNSAPKLHNAIILGNNTGVVNYYSNPEYKNSLIQIGNATEGGKFVATHLGYIAGNADANTTPTDIFTDFANKDFTLKETALAVIDKGDNSLYEDEKYGDKDLAGNTRIVGSAIDLGAYEFQTVLSTTNVEKFKTQIYPNPTSGIFFIKTEENSKAELYNLSGQLVKTLELKKGENQVDISNLPIGLYLVKTKAGVYKVMKK